MVEETTTTETTETTAQTTAPETTAAAETDTTAQDNTKAETSEVKSTLLSKEDTEAEPRVAPEAYEDFKMPEGLEFDTELLEEFTSLSKELKLSQDDAQRLVDIGNQNLQKSVEAQDKAWETVREGWVKSLREDGEFGGAKFKETVERARRSLDKFGDNKLYSMLEQTGYGDNPDLVRMLARIDRQIGEDDLVKGKATGDKSNLSPAEILYPNSNN